MAHQSLTDYILTQLQTGKSQDTIKAELLSAGWPPNDVESAIASIHRETVPPYIIALTGQQHLDPKAVWVFFYKISFSYLVAIFIFMMFIWPFWNNSSSEAESADFEALFVIILVTTTLVLVFSYIWARLTYKHYLFELTETEFKKESGVISKRYVTIPYDQIQNVLESKSLLNRILGLSDLNVYTAGTASPEGVGRYGGSGEGYLPGLNKEVAEKLREELVKRSRLARKV